jgi:hypothetical protein
MHTWSRRLGVLLLCAGALTGAGLPGCTGPPQPQENQAAAHLRTIIQAYDLALYHKGRPPRDAEELKPFLKQLREHEDPDVLLRSPNDGQPYEIVWGVNLNQDVDPGAVLAYEKQGAEGKRYVITVGRIVKEMTEAEFSGASLARGRKSSKGS